MSQHSLKQLLRLLKLQQREVNVGKRAPIRRKRRPDIRRVQLCGGMGRFNLGGNVDTSGLQA
jgi:hypothetical protein